MHRCRNMGVIEIQTVNQRAVDQRCSRKGISFIVSKHRPPSCIHTHAGNGRQQGRSRLGLFSCPNSHANTVRDQQGGPVDDLTRQGLCIYLAREFTKGCGNTLILHKSSLLNLKIPIALPWSYSPVNWALRFSLKAAIPSRRSFVGTVLLYESSSTS